MITLHYTEHKIQGKEPILKSDINNLRIEGWEVDQEIPLKAHKVFNSVSEGLKDFEDHINGIITDEHEINFRKKHNIIK